MSHPLFHVYWEHYRALTKDLSAKKLALNPLEGVIQLFPDSSFELNGKKTLFTLMGLVHGNEVAGLGVVNELLAAVLSRTLSAAYPINVILGNLEAAQENKRFLDCDLNRSFASGRCEKREQKRAQHLEPFLSETALLLDLHQTSLPCSEPFFIFPFNRLSFDFARALDSRLPIVTHWGRSFSQDGMCSDEYVGKKGGIGLTIELGQNGFAAYQLGLGLKVALRAVSLGESYLNLRSPAFLQQSNGPMSNEYEGPIFTFGHIESWPAETNISLAPGFINLQDIKKGQHLGTRQGGMSPTKEVITSPVDGKILFPKYLANPSEKPPAEAFRILRPITMDELPK